jgi:hypothetical protein
MSVALTTRLLLGADVRSLHLFDDEPADEKGVRRLFLYYIVAEKKTPDPFFMTPSFIS